MSDYDANAENTRDFFATIQNKFHWAIHAHTAAEIIKLRADAQIPNMGLTNWPGEQIKRNDVTIAKNYLKPEELDHLNRIVSQYLEFAELGQIFDNTRLLNDTGFQSPEPAHSYLARSGKYLKNIDVFAGAVDP